MPSSTSPPGWSANFCHAHRNWNVNSLKASLEKVSQWLERARPDVLLMQETKLAHSAAPVADADYLGLSVRSRVSNGAMGPELS
jgi:exonuclease III